MKIFWYPLRTTPPSTPNLLPDASGNGHTATLMNGLGFMAMSNQMLVLSFNKSLRQYAVIPAAADLLSTGPLTFSAWVRPRTKQDPLVEDTARGIISNQDNVAHGGSVLCQHAQGMYAYYGTTGGVYTPFYTSAIVGQWTQLKGVFNNGVLTIYQDGIKRESGSGSITAPLAGYILGRFYMNFDEYHFDGEMGEVYLENTAETDSQVLADYLATLPDYTGGAAQNYTLNIGVQGSGVVNPAGLQTYPAGSTVTINAVPSSGWRFKEWLIDGVLAPETTSSINIFVDRDKVITAVFEQIIVPPGNYVVSISAIGLGSTNPAPGSYVVAAGTSLIIQATPTTGWVFNGWSGGASGTQNPLTVVVNSDLSIVANFQQGTTPPPPTSGKTNWGLIAGVGGAFILLAVLLSRKK